LASWPCHLSHVPRQLLFSLNAFIVGLARHQQQRLNLLLLDSHPTSALLATPLKRLDQRTAMAISTTDPKEPAMITYRHKLTTPRAYETCTDASPNSTKSAIAMNLAICTGRLGCAGIWVPAICTA
jgi:hypothetical protein